MEIAMAGTTDQHAQRLHDWLADAAVWTYAPVNYSYAGAVIGMPPKFLADRMTRVAEICRERGEPDLTSLVVLVETGEVGPGHRSADPPAERRRCHEYFKARSKSV
jgi:hypothetical protein